MIGEKWLSDVIFTTVESKANISGVKKGPTGDFQTGSLSKAVNTEKSNEITFKAWLARASERKSTLVFCVDLQHIADLSAVFRKNDIEVHSVTGSTPNQVRSKRLDAFKNGDYPVLLNCGVFTEGTDIPNIDCILLARPTKSRNLLVQMIGRGMRLHPGKTDCHVIDMVASLDVGVVTTPTLFGLDPTELVKEASIIDLKTLRERREQESLTEAQAEKLAAKSITGSSDPHRTITFTDYESIYDLIDDTSGERHIRRISQLAWVLTGENRYTLSTQSGDYITIEQNESSGTEYHVLYTARLPRNATKSKSPYMRPREIAQSESFSSAVHAADTFASEKFLWRFISHSQRWRQTPATDGQIAFLNKFRDMDDQLTSDDLTKGKATDSITKLKFGARGRFSKLEAVRKKRARHGAEMDLVTRMRQRERVATGKTIDTY